jgi:hypothetical protein
VQADDAGLRRVGGEEVDLDRRLRVRRLRAADRCREPEHRGARRDRGGPA